MFTSSRAFFFYRFQLIKLIFGKLYSIKFLRLIYNGNFFKFTDVNTKLYINLYIERKSPNAISYKKPMTHIYSVGVEAGTETSNNSTVVPAGENSALALGCILGLHMHLELMLDEHNRLPSAIVYYVISHLQIKTLYCHSYRVWHRILLLCACIFENFGFLPLY